MDKLIKETFLDSLFENENEKTVEVTVLEC